MHISTHASRLPCKSTSRYPQKLAKVVSRLKSPHNTAYHSPSTAHLPHSPPPCCSCHTRPNQVINGYTCCTRRIGEPYAECECSGMCPPGQCPQWECVGHRRFAPIAASLSSLLSSSHSHSDELDEKRQLSPERRPSQRLSGRSQSSPFLYMHEQEDEHERSIQRVEAAVAAPQVVAAPPQAVQPAPQAITQLPTVASIASHRHLHDAVPYALQPLWRELCEPAFERYRRASQSGDEDEMAAALISILRLPGKHLYKQRVPARVRRTWKRQQRKAGDVVASGLAGRRATADVVSIILVALQRSV